MKKQEIVLFSDDTIKLEVPISPDEDTVWLTLEQMSSLFEKDRSVIGKHIRNIFNKGELDESTSGQIMPRSKGANLLYLIVKNHSFVDGNKRIVVAIFIYFLRANNMLEVDGQKIIDGNTLVAITIIIAESKPNEKEIIINLVMNFLSSS